MSSVTRRRAWVAIFLVMLVLAALNLILVMIGRGGSWVLVGGALAVAVGPLNQLLTFTVTGERVSTTGRGVSSSSVSPWPLPPVSSSLV